MELGKVEGFWSALHLLQQTLVKYLNVEQRAHWLPIQERTSQLWLVIMMSLCHIELEPIGLRHLEFLTRTLHMFNVMICVWCLYLGVPITNPTYFSQISEAELAKSPALRQRYSHADAERASPGPDRGRPSAHGAWRILPDIHESLVRMMQRRWWSTLWRIYRHTETKPCTR